MALRRRRHCGPDPDARLARYFPRSGVRLYNDGYAVVCGKRHPAVLGGSLRDAWPEAWDLNGRMLANCMAGNHETHQNVSFLLERDGGPRESWFDLYYGPVRGADGDVAGVLATVIEITDKVEAEQARSAQRRQLDRTTSRYQALTAATSDVIYSMSADWSEMRLVDGRGFIKDMSEPAQSWVQEYVPPDEQPRVLAAIDNAIATQSIYELEQRVLRADGSIGWTLSRAVPIVGADGEVEEWFGVASDITERKLAEEKLKESDRRKDEFLAMLAHELRNPLAPIGTACGHTLALDLAPGATLVLGDGKRLVQVVSNILNNAAKYTREGGTIRVAATADDTHVTVSVTDDGVGMTPTCWPCCWRRRGTGSRWSTSRGARSNGRARSGRRPASSTSACRTWTATCSRSACAPSRPPPARCSWPRRAMARTATAGVRWMQASTTTSSSRSISRSCTRSSTRPFRAE